MKINENYKIESDETNVELLKRVVTSGKDKDGNPVPVEEKWIAINWYSSIEGAYKDLVAMEAMGSGMEDLETVVQALHKIYQEIERAINE